jgi:hypothetical protein
MKTDSPSDVSPRPAQAWRDLLDNRQLILIMLFLVTAALGLPFLWLSRAFSPRSKIFLTFLVLAWTALIFWVFWLVMARTIPPIVTGLEDLYGSNPTLHWIKELFE